jgi:flagellar basal-body rod protein FlgC
MLNLLPGAHNSASALQAERVRLEVIAQNIANANTTKTADGTPYQRQVVKFETMLQDKIGSGSDTAAQSVRVARIMSDVRPPEMVFQPGHPDADPETNLVAYPNVKIHEEMADMIASSRAYEANLAVIKNARAITLQTLAIGRK